MTRVYSLREIEKALPHIDVVSEIEKGFAAYSRGEVTVPPVGELLFPENRGEMHVKCGAVTGDDVFVVKIATGFFDNAKRGLPPFGGCMLVLSQQTGLVLSVLLEEGELTNHRTAAAGAVAARHLAPSRVGRIGIVGTGVQARLQADYLRRVTPCRALSIWGRTAAAAGAAADHLAGLGFDAVVEEDLDRLAARCELIVTTTPSHAPLLGVAQIRPGTHITAMGSDTPEKNELAPDLLARAERVVADSISQCLERGEIFHAIAAGVLAEHDVVELGAVIADPSKGRGSDEEITIADLTGVAVQDIMIAKAVVAHLEKGSGT